MRAKGGNKGGLQGGPGPGGSDDSAGAGISTGKLSGCAVHAPTTAPAIGRVNRALDVNRALARVPWAIIATSGSMAPSSAICACVSGLSSAMSERAAAAISGCPRFGLTSHETKAEIAPAFATSSAAPARSASSPSVVAARTLALGLPWRSSWHKGSIPPPSLMACRLDPRIIRGHQRSSEVIRGHQRSSEVIRGHQRSSEVIRGHQRSSEIMNTPARWRREARGPRGPAPRAPGRARSNGLRRAIGSTAGSRPPSRLPLHRPSAKTRLTRRCSRATRARTPGHS